MMYKYLEKNTIGRDNSFTTIRLVCCFFIMYAHIVVLCEIDTYFIDTRQEAVNIFFILSGFWVTHSLLNAKNLRHYFAKRIKKIIPLYYSVIILTCITFAFFTVLSPVEYFQSRHLWKYILSNLSFANFLCNTLPGVAQVRAVNSALWTLKIEVGFYILLPLLMWLISRWKKNGRSEKVLLLGIFVVNWVLNIGIIYLVSQLSLPEALKEQLPWYFPFFIAGMILYFGFDEIMSKSKILFPISVAIVVLYHFTQNDFLYFFEPFGLAIIVFAIGTKVSFLKKVEKRIPVDLSYPMYLLHCPVMNIFLCLGVFAANWRLGIITTIVCTVVISWLLDKVLRKVLH